MITYTKWKELHHDIFICFEEGGEGGKRGGTYEATQHFKNTAK